MAMRGLTVFISDLRNCSNKEQEAKRRASEKVKARRDSQSSGRAPPT